MIVKELERILKNPGRQSATFDSLVDDFREGRDAFELIELLDSANDELVQIGCYILGEIQTSKYDNELFRKRLRQLTTHSVPAIRLHSFNAIFPFLGSGNTATVEIVTRLLADENDGVRMTATAAARRLQVFEQERQEP